MDKFYNDMYCNVIKDFLQRFRLRYKLKLGMKRAPLSLTDNMLCYRCKNFNNVSYVNSTIYSSKENYLIQLVT